MCDSVRCVGVCYVYLVLKSLLYFGLRALELGHGSHGSGVPLMGLPARLLNVQGLTGSISSWKGETLSLADPSRLHTELVTLCEQLPLTITVINSLLVHGEVSESPCQSP